MKPRLKPVGNVRILREDRDKTRLVVPLLRWVYPGWYRGVASLRWCIQGVQGCICLPWWYTQGGTGVYTLLWWYTQGGTGYIPPLPYPGVYILGYMPPILYHPGYTLPPSVLPGHDVHRAQCPGGTLLGSRKEKPLGERSLRP